MFRFLNIHEHPIFVYWLQHLLISRFLTVEFLFLSSYFLTSQPSRTPSFCLTWGGPFDFYIRVSWVDDFLGNPQCIFRSFFLVWLYSPRIFSSLFRVEFWLQKSEGWVGGWGVGSVRTHRWVLCGDEVRLCVVQLGRGPSVESHSAFPGSGHQGWGSAWTPGAEALAGAWVDLLLPVARPCPAHTGAARSWAFWTCLWTWNRVLVFPLLA